MIARVAVWEPMPDDDRQWVIDGTDSSSVLGAYHLVDPVTGNGRSIAFMNDELDVERVKAAIEVKASRDRGLTYRAPRQRPRPSTRSSEAGDCGTMDP